jgi:hypothetical protein
MFALTRYLLSACRKDFIFVSLSVLIGISFAASLFFGWTLVAEVEQTRIVYFAGSVRFVTMFGLIVFISFFISRFFENKEIEMILSFPISRVKVCLAFFTTFWIVCFVLTIIIGGLMAYFFKYLSMDGYAIWLVSFFCEMVLISSFAVFFSLILKNTSVCVFFVTGFYLLSRSVGFMLSSLETKQASIFLPSNEKLSLISSKLIEALGFFFPRLDLFSNSSWLLYGGYEMGTIAIIICQTIVFLSLLLFCTFRDFKNKSF